MFFFLNECLSLNGALAYLEWLLVLQTLRGKRPKTKVTPEVKKIFFVKYKLFFCIALRTVILKNCQLREVLPFPRACHICSSKYSAIIFFFIKAILKFYLVLVFFSRLF